MRGYAWKEIFPAASIVVWEGATKLVEAVPEDWEVRCHELARAVGEIMDLSVVDGMYGIVEHSWLKVNSYTILDPYQPGSLPLVQLHDTSHPLPHLKSYKEMGLPEHVRIDSEEVAKLVEIMLEPEKFCRVCGLLKDHEQGCECRS